MGSECSENEREFRYRIFHEAIYAIENDIKKDLNNTNKDKKQYLPFGLINHDIIKKYKFLSNKNFDSNEARIKKFDYKHLIKINENKDFTNINKRFDFCFPSNFMFINQDFLDVINDYIDKEYSKHLRTIFITAVGGDCLLMKNRVNENDSNPFRYIVLYSEINENKGNEINFFLFID